MNRLLKEKLKPIAHALLARTSVVGFLRRLLRLATTTKGACSSPAPLPKRPDATFLTELPDPVLARKLDEIPSQTSRLERHFLYTFFSSVWEGTHDVIEIGPFLGGTTRAIALGMLANPRRASSSRLHTFDRFRDNDYPEEFLAYLEPLFAKGLLDGELRETVRRTNSFWEVFQRLHAHESYGSVLRAKAALLPETPDEVRLHPNLFIADRGHTYSAVFVDGCKAWYATKYFLMQTGPVCTPGAFYLFQDYGWYKCFWIPVFVHLLGSYFKASAYVDSTYVFQLTKALRAVDVENLCPDQAEGCEKNLFDNMFTELKERAHARGDERGFVTATLQHAAALAYIGEEREARDRILSLAGFGVGTPYEAWIQSALKNPTYRPSGRGVQPVQVYLQP